MVKLLIGSIIFGITITIAWSHQASPTKNDVFMDTIQAEVEGDVREVQQELVVEAKAVAAATERYAKAKLAQNIFRALRLLAMKELEQVPMQLRMRQPRQEELEESPASGTGDDEDSGDGGSSSGSSDSSTTKRTVPLIPVLAGILKSVFGGGENATTAPLNVTQTLNSILFPLGNPFQGVQALLNRRRPTAAPATVIKYYPVPIYPTTEAPPPTKGTTPLLRLVGRDEGSRVRRQASPAPASRDIETTRQVPALLKPLFPNSADSSVYAPAFININKQKSTEFPPPASSDSPMLIYAPNHMVGGAYAPLHPITNAVSTPKPEIEKVTKIPEVVTTRAPAKTRPQEIFIPVFAEAVADPTTTSRNTEPTLPSPTASTASPLTSGVSEGSEETTSEPVFSTSEAPKPGLIYVDSLARDVQNGFDGLVKNLPDILKGAKEALGLLANIREIFGGEDDS